MRDSPLFPTDRVTVVGVLNVTPDSFSDGGQLLGPDGAPHLDHVVTRARELARAGADVLDVGGESTRPGASPVPASVEIDRTRPVVEALAKALPTPISIDTRHRAVAEAALDAGARVVNDVSGGRHDPGLLEAVARTEATLIVGHLRGEPATMQRAIRFDDVLEEVAEELASALATAREAGVAGERLVADPGIGFGKQLVHNTTLLANVGMLRARLGVPLLVGPSRKAFLGELTGEPVSGRDPATAVVCGIAVFAGADAVRVHDVAGVERATRIAAALREARRAAA
jgi:dihydropteroate synthase